MVFNDDHAAWSGRFGSILSYVATLVYGVIGDDGRTTDEKSQPSNGPTPFGLIFGKRATVLVSEAGSSSVSSYRVADPDMLNVINGSVPDSQKAACWVAVTNSGRFAFVTNTGSGTVSSYRILPAGEVALISAMAATTGPTGAVDLAFSRDSRFLYVVNAALGTVTGFAVNEGALRLVGSIGGLPMSVQGIVVHSKAMRALHTFRPHKRMAPTAWQAAAFLGCHRQ
jgi:6-phosphogluconolactonase